jgi:amino acid transporter
MELVAIAASETKNPRRNIGKAVRRVYFRIIIFYLLGVLVTGMLVAYNDPHLLVSTNTAAESPYVIAFSNAGIKGLPHVINAGVFTSAFSAGNSFLFCASRILYGLSLRGQAPRVFTKCTKNGLPWVAVSATALFSLLSFLSLGGTASTAFLWLQSLTTVGGFFAWGTINFTYLRFCEFHLLMFVGMQSIEFLSLDYGAKAQGIDRKKFVYFSNLQPYLAYWGTLYVFSITDRMYN